MIGISGYGQGVRRSMESLAAIIGPLWSGTLSDTDPNYYLFFSLPSFLLFFVLVSNNYFWVVYLLFLFVLDSFIGLIQKIKKS